MEARIINMDSVQDYNNDLGVETLHPLVSVVDMSELPAIHLSPNYFGDLVKRETGISAQEYIQQHLIEKAKSLLVDKQMTVSQAAYALGYKYPHHLSRMFKRVTGITSNEYRLQN